MSHVYETIVILNPEINPEKTNDYIYRKIITLSDNDFHPKRESIGVKKLAYEIRGHNEGYYAIYTWKGDSSQIEELDKYFRINDKVLKFVTIVRDETTVVRVEEDCSHTEADKTEQSSSGKPIIDLLDIIYNLKK